MWRRDWRRAGSHPARRRRGELGRTAVPVSTDAADETAEEGEEDEAADGDGDADDDAFVGGEPGADFAADGGAFALALGEMELVSA